MRLDAQVAQVINMLHEAPVQSCLELAFGGRLKAGEVFNAKFAIGPMILGNDGRRPTGKS